MYKWITNYIAENDEKWEVELVRIQQEFEEQEKTEWKEMNREEKIKTIQDKNLQLDLDKKTSDEEKWTVWRRDCTESSQSETDMGYDNTVIHPVDKNTIKTSSQENNKLVNTEVTL